MHPPEAVQTAIDAMRTHNWVLLFAVGVMLAIWGLRAVGSQIRGKLGAFVASSRGGALLNFMVSFVAAVVASLIAHRPLSDGGLWMAALTGSVAAAGGWAQLKALLFPPDAAPLHVVVVKGMRRTMGLGLLCVLTGCATVGGQAFKRCELGLLPATEQAVLADVGTVILNQASVLADLVALGFRLGAWQVGCAIKAWDAYLASKQPAAGARMLATGADPRAHAIELTRAYLAANPATSCGPRPAMTVSWL